MNLKREKKETVLRLLRARGDKEPVTDLYTPSRRACTDNRRKSHSKSLRDGIFVVKLGFFAKKTLLRIVAKNASNFVPV